MADLSKICTQFSTSEEGERLARLVLDAENRAMGSGGYSIDRTEGPNGSTNLSLNNPWSSGPMHHIFIKDGEMWATSLAGWLLDLLSRRRINFTTKQVSSPPFIISHMTALVEADQKRKRRYG